MSACVRVLYYKNYKTLYKKIIQYNLITLIGNVNKSIKFYSESFIYINGICNKSVYHRVVHTNLECINM